MYCACARWHAMRRGGITWHVGRAPRCPFRHDIPCGAVCPCDRQARYPMRQAPVGRLLAMGYHTPFVHVPAAYMCNDKKSARCPPSAQLS